MSLEDFQKELNQKLAAMSDEELMARLRRCGFKCEGDPDDNDSQTDYKNSLKNDY